MDSGTAGLKVGLEIHQQLATCKKLFCGCAQAEPEQITRRFTRRLRASKSEMGGYDPAAVFEGTKSKVMAYGGAPGSTCLVEEDEEPPHDPDPAAVQTALLIAASLKSHIFREMFVMRKIVIDGSNTAGFQRTMLVSQGGSLRAGERTVGVQSICLEEDAARLVGDDGATREYGLDRLGIPLVEIALEPVEAGPAEMRAVALALGKLLRTTGRVARGLGTIRQDINVSFRGGGVVEVKGVQQLDQFEKVVAFEARRQEGLYHIAQKLQDMDIEVARDDVFDVSDILRESSSGVIQDGLRRGDAIRAVRIRNFAGLFGYEPSPGIRLGREIAGLARSFGVGGVLHSDELPGYGVEEDTVEAVRERLQASKRDGFLIVSADPSLADHLMDSILDRILQARLGVPAETRQAQRNGETTFLRPRPGPSRMYPETDIAPITVTDENLEAARRGVPKPWDEMLADFGTRYGLNPQLAEQILDSPHLKLFEEICGKGLAPPDFVASTLCYTITRLQWMKLETELCHRYILETFQMLSSGRILKESMKLILDRLSDDSGGPEEIATIMGIKIMDAAELDRILSGIVSGNRDLVARQGERAIGTLMGMAMRELRGRAPGSLVSAKLREMVRGCK